jgi:HD-like signal output (HDOD) protein
VATQPAGPTGTLASVVASALDIPTIPAVATKVIKAVEDDRTTADALAKIIVVDQGITARILRVCNSAFYGMPRQITSLQRAVTVLGMRELKNLVISASTRNLYKNFGPVEQQMWEHSAGCAMGAQYVALKLCPSARDLAFLAGQMHDVGKVIMRNKLVVKFDEAQILSKTMGTTDAEAKVFGYSHTDVGALLMKRWNMPEAVELAAFLHHDLSLGESVAGDHIKLVACVALANHLCHACGVGGPPDDNPRETQSFEAAQILGVSEETMVTLIKEFGEKYAAEAAAAAPAPA